MKIVIMHARKGQARRLTVSGLGLAALLACTLGAAAGAGALLQRYSTPVIPPAQADALPALEQSLRDAAFVRESVNMLAAKVGAMQARLASVEGLGKRVAQVAGVPYSDPELAASGHDAQVMDYLDAQAGGHAGGTGPDAASAWDGPAAASGLGAPDTAEQLGRQLDRLREQLAFQADSLSMLDVALTRRSADQARLPTTPPIADFPYLSSSYGWRRNPVTGRYAMHEGLDFAAPAGTPIVAATGGVVIEAKRLPGYGNTVEIDHGDGVITRYAHAQSLLVKRGDLVARGQTIATVGSSGRSTGPHLHFEVRMAGQPVDPTLFLAGPRAGPSVAAASAAQSDERRVR